MAVAAAAVLIAAPRALAQTASAPPESGVWIDHTGKGAVEITPCGAKLCGHIFWLKEPSNAKGQPLIDIYNPDSSKRKRAICGLPVLGNLQRQSGGAWDAGWIYDPKEGKSYDLEIKAAGRSRLSVTGYMGSKFFSKTMIWTRAKPDLTRCAPASKPDAIAKTPAQTKSPAAKSAPASASADQPVEAAAQPEGAPTRRGGDPASGVASKPQRTEKAAAPADRGNGPTAKAPAADATAAKIARATVEESGPARPNLPAEPILLSGPVPARRPAATGQAGPDAGAANAKPPARIRAGTDVTPPPR